MNGEHAQRVVVEGRVGVSGSTAAARTCPPTERGRDWGGTNKTDGCASAACLRRVQSTCCLCRLCWWRGEWLREQRPTATRHKGERVGACRIETGFDDLPCIGARCDGLTLASHGLDLWLQRSWFGHCYWFGGALCVCVCVCGWTEGEAW